MAAISSTPCSGVMAANRARHASPVFAHEEQRHTLAGKRRNQACLQNDALRYQDARPIPVRSTCAISSQKETGFCAPLYGAT
jgi:hypothetical protein